MRTKRKIRLKNTKGQSLIEFAIMSVTSVIVLVSLLFLLGVFTNYGARIIGFVAWEPNPVSHTQMESF